MLGIRSRSFVFIYPSSDFHGGNIRISIQLIILARHMFLRSQPNQPESQASTILNSLVNVCICIMILFPAFIVFQPTLTRNRCAGKSHDLITSNQIHSYMLKNFTFAEFLPSHVDMIALHYMIDALLSINLLEFQRLIAETGVLDVND